MKKWLLVIFGILGFNRFYSYNPKETTAYPGKREKNITRVVTLKELVSGCTKKRGS